MTLKALIASDAKPGGVFLPVDSDGATEDFNELVNLYPESKEACRVQINCIFDLNAESGTNEAWGDGPTLNDRDGRKVRRSAVIECHSGILKANGGKLRDVQPKHNFDAFKRGNEFWAVKRIDARDNDMVSIRVERTTRVNLTSERRSG